MKPTTIFLIVIFFITQSCTYRIQSVKYDANLKLKKSDLFYHLPKTILVLNLNYKIVEKTKIINGIANDPIIDYFVKSADVKTISINDPNQLFIARGKNISNQFFLKENIDFKFNDKGVIQSIETTFEDKTLESTESLLKGVAAIVKTIALAGQGSDPYLTNIKQKISITYDDLAKAISTNNQKDILKYKNQLKNYLELLNSYNDNNKETIKEYEKTYTFYIDPDKINITTVNSQKIKKIKIQPLNIMPDANLIIEMDQLADNKINVLSTGTLEEGHTLISGLLYNIPASLKTIITVSTVAGASQNIFESNLDYGQYGNLGFVPVTSKVFTSRKSNIEFNSSTGTLTSYKTESGSSSENLGKAIENNTSLLKTTVTEINYDNKIDILKKQAELKILQESLQDKPKTQIDSFTSSLNILKLQLDIKKLQKEIEELDTKK